MKNIFRIDLKSKDVKIRVQNFCSQFCEIYFCKRLNLKNFMGLIFANLQNNIF